MVQEELDEIIEAANSVLLICRAVQEMEMDSVELGTCARMLEHCSRVICSSVEQIEGKMSS